MKKYLSLLLLLNTFIFAQSIEWKQKQSLPKAYRNGSAAASNGKIYFMGGYCDAAPERYEKSNYEYNPDADTWTSIKEIPTGRSNFAMAAIENKIYVIGGDPFSPKNEVYSPITDSWETMQPMLTPRQHISCAVVDGKIFIAGGLMDVQDSSAPAKWSYKNITDKNEVYDPVTNKWKGLAPMPTKRHGAFMASVDGKVYVIGGMGDEKDMWKTLSVVEMYDPEKDEWETKANLPEPRDGFGISVMNDKIFVIGGFSGPDIVNSVYVYEPQFDKWSISTDFPNRENGAPGCAVIGNKIYIIGGCDKNYTANGNTFEGMVINDKTKFDYFGQTPPDDTPVVFAPGIISVDNKNSHALVVSPDGNMVIFSRYPDRTSYILTKENGKWKGPEESFFYGKEVSFSPDGNRIYYYTGDDIYYVERKSNEWRAPARLGVNVNTQNLTEYYPCLVHSGDLYFSRDGNWSTGKIMHSKFINGEFAAAEEAADDINSGGASHCYVAPDESYMLFNSPRAGSYTKNDIWVSFRKKNGQWGKPENTGKVINSGADAILCPTVSPDGKYMFFTKLNTDTKAGIIYWCKHKIY